MHELTVGSLFAGIGGFDLGFERAGMQTIWQVEQSEFCRVVLAQHFPDAERYEDVREVGVHNLAPVDLICGGFPCQDISLAGKGAGIDGERSGLWAEFARIIGELGPQYAVVENVSAIRSRGLDRVLRDLAALGYDAEWDCIPASAVGAPHQRDRFWLVAYPNEDGARLIAGRAFRDGWEVRAALGGVTSAPHSDSDSRGCGIGGQRNSRSVKPREQASLGRDSDRLRPSLAHAPSRSRNGQPAARPQCDHGRIAARGQGCVAASQPGWPPEPKVDRVVDGFPGRVDQVRALGNALVPQIAQWIGERILDYEKGGVKP